MTFQLQELLNPLLFLSSSWSPFSLDMGSGAMFRTFLGTLSECDLDLVALKFLSRAPVLGGVLYLKQEPISDIQLLT